MRSRPVPATLVALMLVPLAPATADELQRLGLARFSLQQLPLPDQAPEGLSLTVQLGDRPYTLQLRPQAIRSPDFRLLVVDDQGISEAAPPEPCTLRGVVLDTDGAEVPGGAAAASLLGGKLNALIDLGGGVWTIQPLADRAEHVVFHEADVPASGRICGVNPANLAALTGPGAAGDDGQPEAPGEKIADIAIDADFQFYQLNGSNLNNTVYDIENVINAVEFIYERDVDITYEVTTIVVRTSSASNPYTTSDPGSLLSQFQSHWNSNFTAVRRDTAHLFTGRFLDGSVIGIAYLAVICSTGSAYGLSESRFSGVFNDRVTLTAHELGHNWSANHCDANGNGCNIMCSSVNGCGGYGLPDFSPPEQSVIESFRDSRTCLLDDVASIQPNFFDDFSPATLSSAKWIYNFNATVSTNAINEPSPTRSLNLNAAGSSPYQQDEVRSSFILLGGQNNVTISYWVERIGVEAGERLFVDYWNNNLTWVNINTLTSDGVDQSTFTQYSHVLPPDANHNEFRLRFRTSVNETNDNWYIDDVSVAVGDGTPPSPNPAQFAGSPVPLGTASFQLAAVAASDGQSPPVQYFFDFVGGSAGGTDSGWLSSPDHIVVIDAFANPNPANAGFNYVVRTRDSATPNPNVSADSAAVLASTAIQTPTGVSFGAVTDTSIIVQADGTFNNLTLGQSGIYFEMTPAAGSGANQWVQATGVTVTGLTPGATYTFRAKARNFQGFETPYTAPAQHSTKGNTCALPGDVNSDSAVNALDIAGFVRVKIGLQYPGDDAACADFGNGDVTQDILEFVAVLLGGPS